MIRVGILNSATVVGYGGGFQYLRSLIEGLRSFRDVEVVVFYDDPRFADYCASADNLTAVPLPKAGELVGKIARTAATVTGLRSPWLGRFDVLRHHQLDCLVSTGSLVGFHLGIPFVGIVYDVMHKYYPDCAEYSLKERIFRDFLNPRIVRYATLTIVDSEKSRDDLVRFYGMDPERIRPVPLCPPPHVYRQEEVPESMVQEIADKYRLPARFVFYPAQLWDHKNHRRLFDAIARLRREEGLEVPLVLVGSAGGNGAGVLGAIRALGLEKQVFYLGYVEEREVVALYKAATALVFPSFADYTNIPILEAMALGAPVLCSNAFAMPEQLGGVGLLFDPFDVKDMAQQILRVWRDEEMRTSLVEKGRERVRELSLEAFGKRWRDVIQEAVERGR